jgi:hypothetical protein
MKISPENGTSGHRFNCETVVVLAFKVLAPLRTYDIPVDGNVRELRTAMLAFGFQDNEERRDPV